MTAIRYEVWTRQESGTFERKFPIRGEIAASFATDLFGRATLTLPVNHPRIDDLLFIDQSNRANDNASVLRAYIGSVNIFDFYIESVELNFTDTGSRTATINGSARGTLFDRVSVRQYDWNVKPSIDPDWIYGVTGQSVLVNGGFEDWDLNGGAESGSIDPWSDTKDTSVFDVPAVTLATQTTDVNAGTYAYEVTPAGIHSGMEFTFPVIGGEQYSFSALLKEPSASGERYTLYIKMGEDSTMNVGAGIWSGYAVAELGGAALLAGASDGTWQSLFSTVTFGPDVTETTMHIIHDEHGGSVHPLFRVDQIAIVGPGVGLEPWEPLDNPTTFVLDTSIKRTGTNSLKWQTRVGSPIGGSSVRQLLSGLIIGKTYTWGAWFRHDAGGNEPIRVISYRRGNPANEFISSDLHQIPTGTAWTFAWTTFEADLEDIYVDWRYDAVGPSPNFWIDDGAVTNGLPPDTVGKILNDLLNDASVDHVADGRTALAWLTRTFTDSLDSSGVAWDANIDLRIRRGLPYRAIIESMENMGYEFSVDVDPTDETIWRFNAYNPDNMGTDHSVLDGPAILSRPGVLSAGPFLRREPVSTYTMVEGDDFYWEEYRNTAMETAWGELETYVGSQDSLPGILLKQATEVVTSDPGESLILSFANHILTPGIDYDVGDLIRITLGDVYWPSSVFRVAAISVRDSEVEPQFQVEFQPV